MSFVLNLSGHVDDRDAEEELVDDLVTFVADHRDAVSTANLSTTHIGSVDLVARVDSPPPAEETTNEAVDEE